MEAEANARWMACNNERSAQAKVVSWLMDQLVEEVDRAKAINSKYVALWMCASPKAMNVKRLRSQRQVLDKIRILAKGHDPLLSMYHLVHNHQARYAEVLDEILEYPKSACPIRKGKPGCAERERDMADVCEALRAILKIMLLFSEFASDTYQ